MARCWWRRRSAGLGVVAMGVAATVPLVAQPLGALGRIEPGLWQLKSDDGSVRDICLADPGGLVQIAHDAIACTRLVIASDATSATVHYSCPGAGWGRTTLKLSTPRAVAVDTQGIVGKAPFAFTAQARRLGECPPAANKTSLAR